MARKFAFDWNNLHQGPVGPVKIHERIPAPRLRSDHFSDEDGVVSRLYDLYDPAFKKAKHVRKQRSAAFARIPADSFKPAFGFFGENNRIIPLCGVENVDGKMGRSTEMVQDRTLMIDTDQNEWGLQGYRCK